MSRILRSGLFALAIAVIGGCGVLLGSSTVTINPDERGVVFNNTTGELAVLQPGIHTIVPGRDDVTIYFVGQQEYTMSGDDPAMGAIRSRSTDGQEVIFDVTVLYAIDPEQVITVHTRWQNRYADDFIRPTVRNVLREVAAMFTAEDIYGETRIDLQEATEEELRERLAEEGLELEAFLIRDVTFSPEFTAAIEARALAEMQALEARVQAEALQATAEAMAQAAQEEATAQLDAILNDETGQLRDVRVAQIMVEIEQIRRQIAELQEALAVLNAEMEFLESLEFPSPTPTTTP